MAAAAAGSAEPATAAGAPDTTAAPPTSARTPTAQKERRRDPADGRTYTFLEFLKQRKASWSAQEIKRYWNTDMVHVPLQPQPVPQLQTQPLSPPERASEATVEETLAPMPGGGGGAEADVGVVPPPTKPVEERRKNPDDGEVYTLREFSDKFRGQFSNQEILDYWRDAMSPENSGVGKAEAAVAPEDGQGRLADLAATPPTTVVAGSESKLARAERREATLAALPDENGAERRRDPEDGHLYTLLQLKAKYKKWSDGGFSWYEPGFSIPEIEQYWEEDATKT